MDDISAYYSSYQPPPPPPGAAPPFAVVPLPCVSHQPPPYDPYSLPHASRGSHDEVRTLFVAGLPEDVKPREIYNLFREFPGYESSHLRSTDGDSKPFAFAVFSDQQSAIAAMHALNAEAKEEFERIYGIVFDLEKLSTLYIDLAKSNSRSKRSRADDDQHRSKKAKPLRSTPDPGFGSTHMPGMSSSTYDTIGYPPAQSHGNTDAAGKSNNSAAPCPTLFVANLGPNCTEHELASVFSRCRGFLKLKMQSTYGTPVAFVDFQDVDCSTEALIALQGTILCASATGEGLRLQYARSRMGMRKKGN